MTHSIDPFDAALVLAWWRVFRNRPLIVRTAVTAALSPSSPDEVLLRDAIAAVAPSDYPTVPLSPHRHGRTLVRLSATPFTLPDGTTVSFVDRGNLLCGRTWQLQEPATELAA